MRFLDRLICFFLGHSDRTEQMLLFLSWDGITERGSLHCSRCGRAVGEYRRHGFEEQERLW